MKRFILCLALCSCGPRITVNDTDDGDNVDVTVIDYNGKSKPCPDDAGTPDAGNCWGEGHGKKCRC